MPTTDTSEHGLESVIVAWLTGAPSTARTQSDEKAIADPPARYGGAGYVLGHTRDYDRSHAVDIVKLLDFLRATQPPLVEELGLEADGPRRQEFLHRLQGEITRRGVVDVLRNGIKHRQFTVDMFYGTPSPGNSKAVQNFAANVFSVTRQLQYSPDAARLALDLCVFINGLPIATFELKNRLTKQTVEDAVQQYKRDRDPRELLFQFGRCAVHFAVDDQEVRFCAHLSGGDSWFLPFNKGYNDGAGNPPNPNGIKTDYLWREVLRRESLTDILENYAQTVEEPRDNGKKKLKQVFPRYHQLDVVRRLLADARERGAGQRYLVQHSAGSGKSNSIAWLAHQLIGLEGPHPGATRYSEGPHPGATRHPSPIAMGEGAGGEGLASPSPAAAGEGAGGEGLPGGPHPGATRHPSPIAMGEGNNDESPLSRRSGRGAGGEGLPAAIFDSVIVVTDRRNLDKQIRDTIKQFAQVGATVGHAERSGDLRRFLRDGKKLIITTVQKFPFVLDEIGDEHRGRSFAIIIDEAHSSQGGRTAAQMNMALAVDGGADDDESTEDTINRLMEGRKMLGNASYFAFTATPKNKTLEIFGEPWPDGGQIKHRPFHSYTMKQAIQEGFILDVLQTYTPVNSYYHVAKKIDDDPEFDSNRARKKIRRYVESNDHSIRQKAEIMVDHFHEQVLARRKLGGEARAMVVTSGIVRAIQYFHAFESYLRERKSPYRAIIAFSGEHEDAGQKVTEATLNGFASSQIEKTFTHDPYRFLIVADKFQTGYDEPLLHTMYVDKQLSGIKAVQTLSRLNRAHPQKHDTFVLDFANDSDTITASFADYYRTTVLSEETDPNKLHDLQGALDGAQIYTADDVETLVALYLGGARRDQLDPILDRCVAIYTSELDENGQVDFKGKAKAFVRTYEFLASILPYTYAEWEKRSIFLNFLIPKLPAPREEDLSKGILESIDLDSYRVEVRAAMQLVLPDAEAEIGPVPTEAGGRVIETELDRLSNILHAFNDQFGNVDWRDGDKIRQVIAEEIPAKVAADKAYQNAMKNSDKQNARIEHDRALQRVIIDLLTDHTDLFKLFSDNPAFKRWLGDVVFSATYEGK